MISELKGRQEAHAEWLWQQVLDGRTEAASLRFIAKHHRSYEVQDRARAMHNSARDRRETLVEKRQRSIKENAPPKEERLTLAILRYLQDLAGRGAKLLPFRVPTDSLSPGAPDLVVLFDDGRCLNVEVKRKGCPLTARQRAFRTQATGLGHFYTVIEAASTADAVNAAGVALTRFMT